MSARTGWGLGIAALAALAIGVWLARDEAPGAPDAPMQKPMPVLATPPAPQEPTAPAADHRLADHGRLTLRAGTLPLGRPLVLALDLPDEARGQEPRSVRIAAADGHRQIETRATSLAGAGTGVQIEIDPDWLRPGLYLIEVKTAETTHFPVRRYVLEVQ